MIDMTNDSGLFRTADELKNDNFYPIQGNRWRRGQELYLPLYQGRMINQFDHRANSVTVNPDNPHNPYLSEPVTEAQHQDPDFMPISQYWVPNHRVEQTITRDSYAIGFRDIARTTDARSVIVAIVPWAGFGNSIPILNIGDELDDGSNPVADVRLLVANLNAIVFDFVARQKIQGTHLNLYILEQLPVIAPEDYNIRFGSKPAREIVQDHVLRLTYTSHDMESFARDLGYNGDPFKWDPEERRHLRARLDALYFHLYGISNDDAEYILTTFPIVRREDEREFGRYRTSEMIISYMNALAAGDTEVVVSV